MPLGEFAESVNERAEPADAAAEIYVGSQPQQRISAAEAQND
jgi:hypothetical protein